MILIDDESTPVINLTTNTGNILENAGSATLTLASSGNTIATGNIVVTLNYAGTATNGIDYITGTTTATIIAGTTGTTFALTAIQDLLYEGNETVIISIASLTNATTGTTTSQTITIVDDETTPLVNITTSTGNILEASGNVTITLSTSGNVLATGNITITILYSGTTSNGIDFVTGTTTATITAGTTGTSFTVTANQDALFEGNETIVITLGTIT